MFKVRRIPRRKVVARYKIEEVILINLMRKITTTVRLTLENNFSRVIEIFRDISSQYNNANAMPLKVILKQLQLQATSTSK